MRNIQRRRQIVESKKPRSFPAETCALIRYGPGSYDVEEAARRGIGEGRGVSGKKPTRRETRRCSDGEGGHDSVPLLKSARLVGVLLCYGAALDGDPREINDPHRGSTRGSRTKGGEGTRAGGGAGRGRGTVSSARSSGSRCPRGGDSPERRDARTALGRSKTMRGGRHVVFGPI